MILEIVMEKRQSFGFVGPRPFRTLWVHPDKHARVLCAMSKAFEALQNIHGTRERVLHTALQHGGKIKYKELPVFQKMNNNNKSGAVPMAAAHAARN